MEQLNWRRWFPSKEDEKIGLIVLWALGLSLLPLTLALFFTFYKHSSWLLFLRLLMWPVFVLAMIVMLHILLVGEERHVPRAPLKAMVAGLGLFMVYFFVLALNDPGMLWFLWK